jgi:type II secretory pathway component PulF
LVEFGRGIAAVFVLAITVLVALRLIYGARRIRDSLGVLLHTLAWVAIFGSLFGGFILLFSGMGLVLWLICGGITVLVFAQTRAIFQTTLLRLLTLGIEKQVPLPELISAYAAENAGYLGRRAEALAQQLSAGVLLGHALADSRGLLPRYSFLATEVGHCIGDFGSALKEATNTLALRRPLWHTAAGRVYYLGWFFITLSAALGFLMVKVAPAISMILRDYDMTWTFGEQLQSGLYSVLTFAMGLTWLATLILIPYFTLHYLGLIRFGLPGLNRLLRSFETGVVLRYLALGTERGVSLSKMLLVISSAYPMPAMRWRLADVSRDLDAGANWADSMRRRGVINKREAAVLSAAQRLGNVTWALRELADNGERRLVERLEAWSRAIFVVTILVAGLAVTYISVTFYMPLVQMINALAL